MNTWRWVDDNLHLKKQNLLIIRDIKQVKITIIEDLVSLKTHPP